MNAPLSNHTAELTEAVRKWVEVLREAGVKITITINVEAKP